MGNVIGSITGLGSVFALIAKLGMGNIGKLIEQFKVIGNDSLDLKTRVLAAIEAVDLAADFTETQADDMLAKFLKEAAKQEALWTLIDAVGYLIEGKPIPVGAMPEEGLQVGDPGDEKGFIPLPVAIQLAQAIAMIIIQIRNNRK